jgi:hypothetical protein
MCCGTGVKLDEKMKSGGRESDISKCKQKGVGMTQPSAHERGSKLKILQAMPRRWICRREAFYCKENL